MLKLEDSAQNLLIYFEVGFLCVAFGTFLETCDIDQAGLNLILSPFKSIQFSDVTDERQMVAA